MDKNLQLHFISSSYIDEIEDKGIELGLLYNEADLTYRNTGEHWIP